MPSDNEGWTILLILVPIDMIQCFCGYESSSFCSCGYKNIQFIYLIFVMVRTKIKRNSIDTLSNLCLVIYILGEAAVNGIFYSKFTFKLPFFFRFPAWKWRAS